MYPNPTPARRGTQSPAVTNPQTVTPAASFDDYHPVTPDAPPRADACPTCHAYGKAPCTGLTGEPRKRHRSRPKGGGSNVLTAFPSRRKGIGKSGNKRETIAARDGAQCWICGRALQTRAAFTGRVPDDYATFDHVVPRSLGGSSELSNLRLACRPCNGARGATPADQVRTYRDEPAG